MAMSADNLSKHTQRASMSAFKLSGIMANAGKLAPIAAVTGMFKLAESSGKAADDILNTSAALGISTKSLQEYRYAGIMAGLTTEEMDVALTKLTVNLGKDSAATEEALAKIGLTAEQLKAAGPEKVLEKLSEGFQNIKDPTKKAAVVTALFGKSSVRMVNALSGGPKAIKKMREEADKIGYSMGGEALDNAGKFDDALDKLGATAQGLGNRLSSNTIPNMNSLVDSISNGIAPGGQFENIINSFMKIINSIAGIIEPLIIGLSAIITPVIEAISGLLDGSMFKKDAEMAVALDKAGTQRMQSFMEKKISENTGAVDPQRPGEIKNVQKWNTERVPVSSQTNIVNTNTTKTSNNNQKSTVEINVAGLPQGSSVKQTGKSPGITLNTGKTNIFSNSLKPAWAP